MNTHGLAALGLLLTSSPALAASLPIQIDGGFSEWSGPVFATDPAGDDGSSGIDFTRVEIANDDVRVFLRFDTGVEVQPDEFHDITVALDTDLNAGTGDPVGSIGAELVWNLGQRSGTFYAGGSSYSVGHADIGFFVGPTVSDTDLELALDRNAVPGGGSPLFPGSQFRLVILDDTGGGDVFDPAGTTYSLGTTPQPVPSLDFARFAPGDVRIATYNVENDGLFDGGADAAALDNLFDAIDPDIWVFNEVWNHDENEVVTQVESFLPSSGGESWNGVKLDTGNVIVTRFPVLDSWEISPGDRLTAVLVDARPQLSSDLLIVGNHWSCCASDAARQDQADALIEFLDDARTPGGVLDLAADTPIVAAGDFNLVGWRGQLDTVLTGDIADNGTYGPDSPPDWDGSDFDVAGARHPDARLTATWWNDGSTFSPGRLDWIFYTGSVTTVANTFVVETRSMTSANLAAQGLLSTDTVTASDHAPVVADFRAPSVGTGLMEPSVPRESLRLDPVRPNPFRTATTIRYSLADRGSVAITVHDVAGRLVRELASGGREAGSHTVVWDARDRRGFPVAPGVYWVRLRSGSASALRSAVVIR